MNQDRPPSPPGEASRRWVAYTLLVVLAAVVWLFYSFSAAQNPRVTLVTGILLLILLIPLVRRPRRRE